MNKKLSQTFYLLVFGQMIKWQEHLLFAILKVIHMKTTYKRLQDFGKAEFAWEQYRCVFQPVTNDSFEEILSVKNL